MNEETKSELRTVGITLAGVAAAQLLDIWFRRHRAREIERLQARLEAVEAEVATLRRNPGQASQMRAMSGPPVWSARRSKVRYE